MLKVKHDSRVFTTRHVNTWIINKLAPAGSTCIDGADTICYKGLETREKHDPSQQPDYDGRQTDSPSLTVHHNDGIQIAICILVTNCPCGLVREANNPAFTSISKFYSLFLSVTAMTFRSTLTKMAAFFTLKHHHLCDQHRQHDTYR